MKDNTKTGKQVVATGRKADDDKLKFTQFAVDHAVDGICWVGSDARFRYVNDSICRTLGYSRDELLAMTAHDINPLLPKEQWASNWEEVKLKKRQVKETVHRTRDGLDVPVEVAINHHEFGGEEYHCCFVRDITGRKRAEEALKKSEKKLRDITSNLAEGIYVLDEGGRVIFMNPEAERLLGWTMAEMNEKGAHNLVHPEKPDGTHLPFEECGMHNTIKTGRRYISTDDVFIRRDGTVFPISVISGCIEEEGRIVASVTAFRDISERKQIEREREKLISRLQDALATIKTLHGILPICASCKKIRDDKGHWNHIESYISSHTEADFTHSICPECTRELYPEYCDETAEHGGE